MVVGLHTKGIYPWDDFEELLFAEISASSCEAAPAGSPEYYYQWVEAFTRLLAKKEILSDIEMAERTIQFKIGARREMY